MSRVDVIVPCYRYANYLRECVASVLSQCLTDVRVLIIDDASPDNTSEVAGEILASDSRVHLIRHEVNQGHIATYNEGLDWVEGDYTILLSADDLLAPGALARVVELMDAHPEVGLTYGMGILFQSEPPPWTAQATDKCSWEILRGVDFLESCCADGVNPICTPTAVTRTHLQKDLGGYRKELPHSGDMEMWMRFAAHSQIGVINQIQAYYRQHEMNMSKKWYKEALGDWKQRKAAFDYLFREQGQSMPEPTRLARKADRGLSSSAFWAASNAFEAGDSARFQDLLDFALLLDPDLRGRPEYIRLLWKRRAGWRCWSAIRPMVQFVRRPVRSLSHHRQFESPSL